jgi:hypothetical protein
MGRLHPVFQLMYPVMIRRELQRLDLMINAVSGPPTPTLDYAWITGGVAPTHLSELATYSRQLSALDSVPELCKRIFDPILSTFPTATLGP